MRKGLIERVEELADEVENLAYENKRMGEFLEYLGLTPLEISNYIIEGNDKTWDRFLKIILNNHKNIDNSVTKA